MDEAQVALTGALGGALIGGILTIAGTFALHRRTERAQLRALARLVIAELSLSKGSLTAALKIDGGLSMLARGETLPVQEWHRHRVALAQFVRADDDWETINAAYALIELATTVPPDDSHARLQAEGALEFTNKAIAVMERHGGKEPSAVFRLFHAVTSGSPE